MPLNVFLDGVLEVQFIDEVFGRLEPVFTAIWQDDGEGVLAEVALRKSFFQAVQGHGKLHGLMLFGGIGTHHVFLYLLFRFFAEDVGVVVFLEAAGVLCAD